MHVAVLVLPSFWRDIQELFVASPRFSPIWRERLGEIAARHQTTIFPRSGDSSWALDEMLLSPPFYTDVCQPRIASAPESRRGEEKWVLARILCEGSTDLVQTIRDARSDAAADEEFTAKLLEAYAAWNRLEEILARAFPAVSDLLPTLCEPAQSADEDDLARRAGETWQLLRYYHTPLFVEEIVASNPRVLFIVGEFPKQLSLAAAYSKKLRESLRDTKVILYQHESDIYSSMAQAMPALTKTRSLFDHIDGTTVYKDIQDLTVCQVIERLAAGSDTLVGVENLVCRENGRIEYREPESTTIEDYLRHARLGSVFDDLSGAVPARAARGNGLPKLSPTITAAKQTCYWDRCHFCPTSAQSRIKNDPHLDRRASDTAALISSLQSDGAEMTFVGREVVPPTVLQQIVEELSGEPHPPVWSYEGKFETFYTESFVHDLARAGCRGVILGLESPSDALNQAMDKHRPGISVAEIEKIISRMDDAGIAVHVNTIYDLPGTTETDFEQHKQWVARMFNGHRYFHFNTNKLQIMAGSKMCAAPEDYGIQLVETEDLLSVTPRFRRADPHGAFVGKCADIWQHVFGSSWYRGTPLEMMHAIYHESTCCAFWDAAAGRNYFKQIHAEIQEYTEPDELVLDLADSVEVVESKSENERRMWLVDVGGTSGWVRLPGLLWQIIEASIEGETDLDSARQAMAPNLTDEDKAQLRQTVARLIARGTLRANSREAK